MIDDVDVADTLLAVSVCNPPFAITPLAAQCRSISREGMDRIILLLVIVAYEMLADTADSC